MLSYSEFLSEAKKVPKIFVDMDGVLCDFFGLWYKVIKEKGKGDIEIEEDAWSKIKTALQNIDDRDRINKDIAYYGGAEKFFTNLDPLPGGKRIIRWLRDNDVYFEILTSPLGSDKEGSIKGKKKWLEAHGLADIKANFEHEKEKFAKRNKGAILIDDFEVNVAKWKNAGGIGIKHDDETTDNTIELLSKYVLGK